MKNKEIEELLNEHNYPLSDYYLFNKKDIDLLLSYIEQLEKEVNTLKLSEEEWLERTLINETNERNVN